MVNTILLVKQTERSEEFNRKTIENMHNIRTQGKSCMVTIDGKNFSVSSTLVSCGFAECTADLLREYRVFSPSGNKKKNPKPFKERSQENEML